MGKPAREIKMRLITRQIEVEVEVDGVVVKGRMIGVSEQAKIRDKNYICVERKTKALDGTQSTEEKMVLDVATFGRELFCACVTGLGKNAVDMDGKPLKCNEQTKSDIYEFNNEFANEVVKKITKKITEMREGEIKNLKPGVSGTSNQAEPVAKSAG